MKIYKYKILSIVFLFLVCSCTTTAKKKDLKKKAEKVITEKEVEVAEKLPASHYYIEAVEIIKKGDRGNFQKARKNIKHVLKNISSSSVLITYSDAYQLLGKVNVLDKMFDEAKVAYEQALSSDPESIMALNGLGISYLGLKDFEKAKEAFENIEKREPSNFFALMNLGNLYFKKQDQKNAIKYFNKSLKVRHDEYRALFNIAEVYYSMNSYELAKEYYEKSINANQSSVKAINNLSFLLMKEEKYKEALEVYEKNKMKLPPNSYIYYINLAAVSRKTGNLKVALKHYTKALELNPDSRIALKNLGVLYDVYFGKRERAVQLYEKYVKLDGKDKKTVSKWIKIIKGSGAKRAK